MRVLVNASVGAVEQQTPLADPSGDHSWHMLVSKSRPRPGFRPPTPLVFDLFGFLAPPKHKPVMTKGVLSRTGRVRVSM